MDVSIDVPYVMDYRNEYTKISIGLNLSLVLVCAKGKHKQ